LYKLVSTNNKSYVVVLLYRDTTFWFIVIKLYFILTINIKGIKLLSIKLLLLQLNILIKNIAAIALTNYIIA
jgi:hypothetical protein